MSSPCCYKPAPEACEEGSVALGAARQTVNGRSKKQENNLWGPAVHNSREAGARLSLRCQSFGSRPNGSPDFMGNFPRNTRFFAIFGSLTDPGTRSCYYAFTTF